MLNKLERRLKIKQRVRGKISGTADIPLRRELPDEKPATG